MNEAQLLADKAVVMPKRTSFRPNGDGWFKLFTYTFITLFTLFSIIPFWMVVAGSLTSEKSLTKYGFRLWPKEWSLDAYQYLFTGKQVFQSYYVSVTVTVVGTISALVMSAMFAYVLSHRRVKYRNILAFLTYFTFLFGAGLVGFYILITNWLHLKDSMLALILPYLLNPFYTFILVSFFRTVPYEINEAATVDGANELYIFFRIIWPLSMPALATVGLFYALHYWNDWWLALLFIDNKDLHPLQMMIRELISTINIESYIGGASVSEAPPSKSIQFATVCVTIGPIILLYPFLQKYFVKGLTIGSVKG
ncbi:multiple sugar transport system permease protein [Paenibacillus sp. UNCCL117]|uniref:carbohydrate ABC transporter permease n=1 Tax=unclassified Paenibacillus TaxID=185978 RepID=UPI0008899E0F|nr:MULTISPECIES: carbohydrate ABC transporter permease [unclassified Paenibacillus]SDE18923.1 multiple sugar transport system permease protein [Paenibacillus sp. cl123]SFW62120.1 multiple sugar transport system permease protein [Paenibacillus sp. UNCCL117]